MAVDVVMTRVDMSQKIARLPAASPLARVLAGEAGLALEGLPGSGPWGAVLASDVRRAAEEGKPPDSAPRGVPLLAASRSIPHEPQQSGGGIPHLGFTTSVDVSNALDFCAWVASPAAGRLGGPLSLTALIVAATAAVLRRHPRLNARVLDQEIVEFATVNLGVAVALEDGWVYPVLRDVQTKGLTQIQQEISALTDKSRAATLESRDLAEATFSVSGLGENGVETLTPLLNPPQVGHLAVGAVVPSPAPSEGTASIRPVFRATLVADPRGVDGPACARFLADFKAVLEQPVLLLV